MGCFRDATYARLKASPLQQIWRDHLLAGSLRLGAGFADGAFVFLFPERNPACVDAVAAYRECLADETSFVPWTLEDLVAAIRLFHRNIHAPAWKLATKRQSCPRTAAAASPPRLWRGHVRRHSDAAWVDAVDDRYLRFVKLDGA